MRFQLLIGKCHMYGTAATTPTTLLWSHGDALQALCKGKPPVNIGFSSQWASNEKPNFFVVILDKLMVRRVADDLRRINANVTRL